MQLWENETPYAKGNSAEDRPYLVPYIVNTNESHAAVIICPGGGYQRRADHEGEPIAKWLNRLGISAFVLHYRVAPYQHPVPLLDVQRAIRLVRHRAHEWKIDQGKIGVLGFSAGGHLASTAATLFELQADESVDEIDQISCRPDLAILCYPVISFEQYVHEGSMNRLLGEEPEQSLKELLSSEKNVSANTPPVFLWHTADDAAVPVGNALIFAEALSKQQIPYELHIYQNGRHGLGLAEEEPDVAAWIQTCEIWLRKQSFIQKTL
ncbi:alpha/beta hydrolase [Bacillus sp. FJAT-50079]|uniref:alpha/beta hydrolase n=1 Tax=Bacillus sp. FJAT-50079 TaxID=2833577 RepID=UPI001BC955D6|nr:alpha/beta hydrolase [Bacillus sp. FJAT-50079]MBS4207844.1 alpha/beta hydrolase [Bacillus sp. FJAT-50079]